MEAEILAWRRDEAGTWPGQGPVVDQGTISEGGLTTETQKRRDEKKCREERGPGEKTVFFQNPCFSVPLCLGGQSLSLLRPEALESFDIVS